MAPVRRSQKAPGGRAHNSGGDNLLAGVGMELEASDIVVGAMMIIFAVVGLILALGRPISRWRSSDFRWPSSRRRSCFARSRGITTTSTRRGTPSARVAAMSEAALADRVAAPPRQVVSTTGHHQGRRLRLGFLGHCCDAGWCLHRDRTDLAVVQHGPVVDQFRPPAARPHLGGDLRIRRHRTAWYLVLRRAANLPRTAVRRRGAARISCSGATSSSS